MYNQLSINTLIRSVPSIFTEENADRTSEKYQHISTFKIIEKLAEEGFYPTWAAQCQCRLAVKKAYAKHMPSICCVSVT